jgi:hypothetical protein
MSDYDVVCNIQERLMFQPDNFGFAGELYSRPIELTERQREVISRYVFIYQNVCVNRKSIYYSNSVEDALSILENGQKDYEFIYNESIDLDTKRYLLFSVAEYMIHSLSKFINVCFESREFKTIFYAELKSLIEHYTFHIVNLMFSEALSEIAEINTEYAQRLRKYCNDNHFTELREHVEYDHKLLLVYAYIMYRDVINQETLLLCPILGAVLIPPFLNKLYEYFSEDIQSDHNNVYDYIKYSTYDITEFPTVEEQSAALAEKYHTYEKVFVLDESAGTGTTLIAIQKALKSHFKEVTIGAVEFRWDKKIVWNTDREWFDLDAIDYVTPLSYRHYLLLANQISCNRMNISNLMPYTPFMIFEDRNYAEYISKQNIDINKKKNMDTLFSRARLIREVFY